MFDKSRPEQTFPGDADPLGMMTDVEYAAWLEASERQPATDEERAEIIEVTTKARVAER